MFPILNNGINVETVFNNFFKNANIDVCQYVNVDKVGRLQNDLFHKKIKFNCLEIELSLYRSGNGKIDVEIDYTNTGCFNPNNYVCFVENDNADDLNRSINEMVDWIKLVNNQSITSK